MNEMCECNGCTATRVHLRVGAVNGILTVEEVWMGVGLCTGERMEVHLQWEDVVGSAQLKAAVSQGELEGSEVLR